MAIVVGPAVSRVSLEAAGLFIDGLGSEECSHGEFHRQMYWAGGSSVQRNRQRTAVLGFSAPSMGCKGTKNHGLLKIVGQNIKLDVCVVRGRKYRAVLSSSCPTLLPRQMSRHDPSHHEGPAFLKQTFTIRFSAPPSPPRTTAASRQACSRRALESVTASHTLHHFDMTGPASLGPFSFRSRLQLSAFEPMQRSRDASSSVRRNFVWNQYQWSARPDCSNLLSSSYRQ